MNDNSASACFSRPCGLCVNTAGPARSHSGQGVHRSIFINHFLTSHQGYAAGSVSPANCLCINNAKELRRDLSLSVGIYDWNDLQ